MSQGKHSVPCKKVLSIQVIQSVADTELQVLQGEVQAIHRTPLSDNPYLHPQVGGKILSAGPYPHDRH